MRTLKLYCHSLYHRFCALCKNNKSSVSKYLNAQQLFACRTTHKCLWFLHYLASSFQMVHHKTYFATGKKKKSLNATVPFEHHNLLAAFCFYFFSLTVTAKYLPQQLPTDILHLFSSAVQSPPKIVRYYKHACIPTEKSLL